MKIDVAQYGSNVAVLLTICNPSSDAAETPTSASAKFYSISGAAFTQVLSTLVLAEVDSNAGVWGAFLALGSVELSDLIVIATAKVGGVDRSATKLLGTSDTISAQMIVGAPLITATPGPVVDDAAAPEA